MAFRYKKTIFTAAIAIISLTAIFLLSPAEAQSSAKQEGIDLSQYRLYNNYNIEGEYFIRRDVEWFVSGFYLHDNLGYLGIRYVEGIPVEHVKKIPEGSHYTTTKNGFDINFHVDKRGHISNLKLTNSSKKTIKRFKKHNKKATNCQKAAFYHEYYSIYYSANKSKNTKYKEYPSRHASYKSPKHEKHRLSSFISLLQKDGGKILATTSDYHGNAYTIKGKPHISINENGLFTISDKKDRRNADFMIDNCVVTQLNKNKKLHINKINTNLVLPSFDMAILNYGHK